MEERFEERGYCNNYTHGIVKYKLRKAAVVRTFPPLLQPKAELLDANKDNVPGILGKQSTVCLAESSISSFGHGKRVILRNHSSPEADQDGSSLSEKTECLEKRTLRRYPSCFRVSAVRNFPAGCGPGDSGDETHSLKCSRISSGIDISVNQNILLEGARSCRFSEMDIKIGKIDDKGAGSSNVRKRNMEEHNDVMDVNIDRADQKTSFHHAEKESHLTIEANDCAEEIMTRKKVKETLRIFQTMYRKLLQEEERKLLREEEKSGTQTTGMRIALKAYSVFRKKWKFLNGDQKFVGSVPGVEIGDEFHLRVEMCAIGLHCRHQAGIDYTNREGRKIAVSIVSSGRYTHANKIGDSDKFIYSGSGLPDRDQKLERGNLALSNSMDDQIPVRLIHGFRHPEASNLQLAPMMGAKTAVTYIYDGLYLVEEKRYERGKNGHYMFLFHLKRIPGQPELPIRELRRLKRSKGRKGLRVADISQGKERKPIGVVNTINDELPAPFVYTTTMIYPSLQRLTPPTGCGCIGGCFNDNECSCAHKNGGEIPFNHDGAIVQAKPLVYECGPACKCPPSCPNRVSQNEIRFPLEIFKTESRGWGIRSLTSISSGSFICEYGGEIIEEEEAQRRTNDEYLFSIGNNYQDESISPGLASLIPDLQTSTSCEIVEMGFTIDASEKGNVGRFINHSCSPNLYAQNLLYDHDNKSMPHIMFFASQNIPPLQELTYHYNYAIDQVYDSDGNIKKKECHCGSPECCGRLY